MGQGSSAALSVAYEEAVRRMGRREVAAVEEGFNRLAVKGKLSRKEFRTGFLNSVSTSPVPEAVASALFDGFDHDASGYITVREFVCGLAVLRKGTPEEKLRLLFAAYDADRDRRLSDKDLSKFAHALHDGLGTTRERAVDDALKALAAAGPQVDFARFSKWARAHIDSPLVDWIFAVEHRLTLTELPAGHPGEPCLPVAGQNSAEAARMKPLERTESTRMREDVAELNALCMEFGLDLDSASELRAVWRQAAAESQFEVVDALAFRRLLPSAPVSLVDRFFNGLDRSRSGTVSLREWLKGFSACLRGPPKARHQLCFHLFADSTDTLPIDASAELQQLAIRATSLFKEPPLPCPARSTDDVESKEPCPEQITDDVEGTDKENLGPLYRADLAVEPWASRADTLMQALGRVARVDLKLQPRDPREEREIVDALNEKFDPVRPGIVGATWFLISARWWQQWWEFSGLAAGSEPRRPQAPPPIDNADLVEEHGWLRLSLCHGIDYEVITEGAWQALQSWYAGPGPSLPRLIIELDGRCELEMYPLRLRVSRTDDTGGVLLLEHCLVSSRATKLCEVRKNACIIHGIEEEVVVYQRSSQNMDWLQADEDSTLSELEFLDDHQLLLKPFAVELEPPSSPCNGSNTKSSPVGLQNLGNTCYMNASLQCLLHTPFLPEYFARDYLYDLNTEGTWGMVGKLAVAFAELLADVKTSSHRGAEQVAPRNFKRMVGDYRLRFAGWTQQDAQEFLSIFLSGLSEDVNRTKADKPYAELEDSAGRPETEVALEYWALHCARENSVVAALFSGQFRSVLRCVECNHENASFDPFSFLPVPLPEHEFRWVTCVVMGAHHAFGSVVSSSSHCGNGNNIGAKRTLNGTIVEDRCKSPSLIDGISSYLERHTIQLCVRVPKLGRVENLREAVAGLVGLEAMDLLCADVADGYVFRLFGSEQPLSALGEDAQPHIFVAPSIALNAPARRLASTSPGVAQTAGQGSEPPSEIVVYVVHRRLKKTQRYFLNPFRSELFGTPVILRLSSNKCSSLELYMAVWNAVKYLVPDLDLKQNKPCWPFSLSYVKRDGSACSRCSWRQACLGCTLPVPTESELHSTLPNVVSVRSIVPNDESLCLSAEETFGINWDAQVLQTHYRAKIATHVHVHESVPLAQLERDAPERLTQCLDGLVKSENLTAYCSTCSKANAGEYTETPHTKTLHIWGCPPLLVLQLKRFHYGTSGYKLHNLVSFPMKLSLNDYMALAGTARSSTEDMPISADPIHLDDQSANIDIDGDLKGLDKPLRERSPPNNGHRARPHLGGADPVGFRTLARCAEYELYAVVNHIGGFGSGHYTAYVKKCGHWFCCNDSQVYGISEEDIVSANAYLLFYERIDIVAERSRGLSSLFPPHSIGADAADTERIKKRSWARPPGADDDRTSTNASLAGRAAGSIAAAASTTPCAIM